MKKTLAFLLTLISLSTFAQSTTKTQTKIGSTKSSDTAKMTVHSRVWIADDTSSTKMKGKLLAPAKKKD